MFSISIFQISLALAASEGMPHMPMAVETRVETVRAGEDIGARAGFGEDAPMVRMMNLMMVGGSGYEGMDMSELSHVHAAPETTASTGVINASPFEATVTAPSGKVKTGVNTIEVALRETATGKPAEHLKLHAEIFMTEMDMGTDETKVDEIAPGRYRLRANFTMPGQWAVRIGPASPEKSSRSWENLLRLDVRRH